MSTNAFLADSKVISVLQKSEKDSTLLIAPCSSRILDSEPAGHRRSGRCRTGLRGGGRNGPSGRRIEFRLRAGGLHGQCRGRLGQRQEDGRGGAFRRQGFRLPPGHSRGRYGRRSLQGYVGSVAQHSHQTDVDGRDRDGGAYGRLPFILIL